MSTHRAVLRRTTSLGQVKCFRITKGSGENPEMRCRLVAQEFGFRREVDELFAGTPSLTIVKLLLSVVVEKDLALMLLDVKLAFLYGDMRRKVYIELPMQNPRHGGGMTIGEVAEGHVWHT